MLLVGPVAIVIVVDNDNGNGNARSHIIILMLGACVPASVLGLSLRARTRAHRSVRARILHAFGFMVVAEYVHACTCMLPVRVCVCESVQWRPPSRAAGRGRGRAIMGAVYVAHGKAVAAAVRDHVSIDVRTSGKR